jgi:hypothetical protein
MTLVGPKHFDTMVVELLASPVTRRLNVIKVQVASVLLGGYTDRTSKECDRVASVTGGKIGNTVDNPLFNDTGTQSRLNPAIENVTEFVVMVLTERDTGTATKSGDNPGIQAREQFILRHGDQDHRHVRQIIECMQRSVVRKDIHLVDDCNKVLLQFAEAVKIKRRGGPFGPEVICEASIMQERVTDVDLR